MGDDSYLWLEAIDGEQELDWVERHNGPTLARLSVNDSSRCALRRSTCSTLTHGSPGVERCGEFLYNFWRDASRPRGVWRRTTLEEYRKDSPGWDVVIDVDALAAAEDENWVWDGAAIIGPGYTRALVGLSRGGGDASVVREFDMTTRQFVADGFNLPEAKSDISLGRRKHRAGGYRLRRRLANRFRVSPAGQAVAARDASRDGKDMALSNARYRLQHQ